MGGLFPDAFEVGITLLVEVGSVYDGVDVVGGEDGVWAVWASGEATLPSETDKRLDGGCRFAPSPL
jgi:hypothetical protein